MLVTIGAIVLVLAFLVGLFIPGVRRLMFAAANAFLQLTIFVILRIVVFVRDHAVAAGVLLTTVVLVFMAVVVGLIYAVYTNWDTAVWVISLVLGVLSLTAFIVGMWINSGLRAVTGGQLGVGGNPYTIGVTAMFFIVIAMTAMGWPGALSLIVVSFALLCIVVWLYGKVLNNDTKYAPALMLSCASLVFTMTIISVVRGEQHGAERILFAKLDMLDTWWNRNAVADEVEAKLSYATVNERAHVYQGIYDESGNFAGYAKATSANSNGEKVDRFYEVGNTVQVSDAKVPLVKGVEPMIALVEGDNLGETVLSTTKNHYFVVARKVSITGPVLAASIPPKSTPTPYSPGDSTAPATSTIRVEANKGAVRTGVYVKAGDVVRRSASGSVVWDPQLPAVGVSGTSYPCSTLQQPTDFPLPTAGCGALVMEVAGNKYPATGEVKIIKGGEIILDVNDRYQSRADNRGAYPVNLEVRR